MTFLRRLSNPRALWGLLMWAYYLMRFGGTK